MRVSCSFLLCCLVALTPLHHGVMQPTAATKMFFSKLQKALHSPSLENLVSFFKTKVGLKLFFDLENYFLVIRNILFLFINMNACSVFCFYWQIFLFFFWPSLNLPFCSSFSPTFFFPLNFPLPYCCCPEIFLLAPTKSKPLKTTILYFKFTLLKLIL